MNQPTNIQPLTHAEVEAVEGGAAFVIGIAVGLSLGLVTLAPMVGQIKSANAKKDD